MTQHRRNLFNAFLFISPWIIGFALFVAYPLFRSFFLSLTEYNYINDPIFIGLDNYVELLGDKQFKQSLLNSLFMIIVGNGFGLFVTLSIAIMIDRAKSKFISFFQISFFIPTLVPLVISVILWIWILQPNTGIINELLGIIGIKGPGWLADPLWAKSGFMLMGLWYASGGTVLIFLAALKDVPVSIYEAAEIDGAKCPSKNTQN